jgi:isoaspartyl peptidase/L-asparaginase-like protein (Ntn-hydrolase superfamily)
MNVRIRTAPLLVAALMMGLHSHVMADRDHDHDRIDKALDALHDAREELVHAATDFHGHKQAALDKIEIAQKILEDSRGHRIDRAADKIDQANQELHACIDGDRDGDHPNIHRAIRALEDAKDQL